MKPIGFVWSQPSATTHAVFHENEDVLETSYALQLAPTTMRLYWPKTTPLSILDGLWKMPSVEAVE
jgi:hypothetical protein